MLYTPTFRLCARLPAALILHATHLTKEKFATFLFDGEGNEKQLQQPKEHTKAPPTQAREEQDMKKKKRQDESHIISSFFFFPYPTQISFIPLEVPCR